MNQNDSHGRKPQNDPRAKAGGNQGWGEADGGR